MAYSAVSRNWVATLELRAKQQELLQGWVRAHGTPQQVVKRCRIVLLAHEGSADVAIAQELGLNWHTCRLWRERFVAAGAQSLWAVAEGRGRKTPAGPGRTHCEGHAEQQTAWADALEHSGDGQGPRRGREHGVPHLAGARLAAAPAGDVQILRHPQFVPKLLDVVGVQLHPPQNAVVLCVDEKSQIQALDRTQPGLPMSGDVAAPGRTTMCAMAPRHFLPR